jgi:hypothetical protein
MDILILNINILIWKLTFHFWIFYSTFLKIDLKIDIWILNYYFGILTLYFNWKNYWLSFKGSFY